MKVTIFGTGYVGLVTGTCLADVGHHVTCVDIDQDKINMLNGGKIPIYEPGLEEMVEENHDAGRLQFTTEAAEAVVEAEVLFIAVGTPPDEDGSADLKYVLQVATTIGDHLKQPAIIATKSTVPVGTADRVRETVQSRLDERGEAIDFDVVSNPEFLKEGAAVEDCMRPDRIIIGTASQQAAETLRKLYAPFNRNHDRLIIMDVRSAELTKYAANAMLATKISFMNEIANVAERVGADVEMIRRGIGSDPRIGWHFIYPGAGFGGSCFPKDVRALASIAGENAVEPELIRAVESVNDRQKRHLFELICQHYGGQDQLREKQFALWGLAFKPNTDDMREASSQTLLALLWEAGANVSAFDPEAMDEAHRVFGDRDDLEYCESAETALTGADALIIITEWKQFRSPDFELLNKRLVDRTIFDGRNLYEPEEVEAQGLAYYAIGRGRSVLRKK
ncbi:MULTISPECIES: UDP-glucose/GDP-mannose dehydrogenase family protein [unclassified Wenzhouxiangella]|uniref:UDP-glucose dehydrogenase family protein n=1 Tax=unclassified Wenzhouxiangella TaxID=2613841 RepID=UPI000E3251DE|nr:MULTISPECIES: UDP-glucose/GDP-mannose dehydrogenase family protein [unclassified Wenzhouxiangella]RFF27893.1 UDP-glucose/GDP-mannose dehydrogenase family protein [Wenzhouxiangella sp. 15181]RFP69026.1 UDP-glucose/GDP-mannose dehydrogenase family protein [Wenzhouxiangella sp. 15190]